MARAAEVEIHMLTTYDQVADPLDYLFQDPDYREKDQARLAAWRNDEWHFVGIRARATIKIPYGINPPAGLLRIAVARFMGHRERQRRRLFRARSIRKNAKF